MGRNSSQVGHGVIWTRNTTAWDLSSGHPVRIAQIPIAGNVVTGYDGEDGVYVVGCEDPTEEPCQAETLTDFDFTDFAVLATLSLSGLGTITDVSGGVDTGTLPLAMGTDTGDIILYQPNTLISDQMWPTIGPNISSSVDDIPDDGEGVWLSPNGQYIAAYDHSGAVELWRVSTNPNQSPEAVTSPALVRGLAGPDPVPTFHSALPG